MGSCITFSAPDTGGPRIIPTLPPISSGPASGTVRIGMPGIKDILTTGKISTAVIPIGTDTASGAVTIRIFIMSTTTARAAVGMEEAMVEGMIAAMVEWMIAAMVEEIRCCSGGEAWVPVAKLSLTVYPG